MGTIRLKRALTHVALLVGVAISLFPFYWMIVMASNTTGDIFKFPPKLTFGSKLLLNCRHVLDSINFFGSFGNTVMVAAISTVLVLFFDSIAAFVFAKFDFPGKKQLFVILLATFMIPAQLSVVPQFVIMAHLGWVGSFKALIIPGMVNAYGIFFMRQYAEGAVSGDLLEAGRLDGCGFMRLYFNIALPVLRPVLAFLGIFTFIGVWNDYLWPLIVLTDPNRLTLQVALGQLNSLYNTDYSMVMAGTLHGHGATYRRLPLRRQTLHRRPRRRSNQGLTDRARGPAPRRPTSHDRHPLMVAIAAMSGCRS